MACASVDAEAVEGPAGREHEEGDPTRRQANAGLDSQRPAETPRARTHFQRRSKFVPPQQSNGGEFVLGVDAPIRRVEPCAVAFRFKVESRGSVLHLCLIGLIPMFFAVQVE